MAKGKYEKWLTEQGLALLAGWARDGYTDEQINKKISRYEDSDMLYEESEDALDRLKALRQKEVDLFS